MDTPQASTSVQISPQPAVVSPAESPNRRWVLWSAIGLTFLIFGIALGVFGAKFLNQSPSPSPLTSIPSPTLSPIPSPDLYREPNGSAATAEWKTYSSTNTGYSFKYPEDWPLVNEPTHPDCAVCVEKILFTPSWSPDGPNAEGRIIAVVLVFKDNRIKSLEDYRNIIIKGDSSMIDVRDNVVGNEKGISYKLSGGMPPLPIIEYAIVKNGYYYIIRLEDSFETNKNRDRNLEIFDQILSTFKFLDQNE